jgi:archaellum component FlaC
VASKKGNGHDPMTVEMVSLLREIRDGVNTTNLRLAAVETHSSIVGAEVGALHKTVMGLTAEVRELRGEVKELRGEVKELRGDLNAFKDETRGELLDIRGEVHQLNERLDPLAGHEARIARIEAVLFKPAAE